ncbi:cytochrome c biogenesis protein ResB [Aquipuribacter sp. MA13-6]|uniref:cytochrome c biogenesis protein ResB n=1 Tax=unclassified Aquipuribacter TaxID=2635084 RepID=UPI003EE97325
MSADTRTPDATGASPLPPAPTPPPLGARGTARWLWRQLTSMRTALVLLLLLAVATIPGSLFPQRGVDLAAVNTYLRENESTGEWLDRLGFFDVYASPWFAAVYLLLFVSLLGCIVPRARAHVTEWRRRPPTTPRRLERLPGHGGVTVAEPVDVVVDRLTVALRRRGRGGGPLLGHRVDVHAETGGGPGARSLAAETGRLRETGNLLFHVSLVGVLVAMATGSLYSYRGEALVVEGESFSNVLQQYDSINPGARFDATGLPPFSLRLDALDVAFEEEQVSQLGSPRNFEAAVTVTPSPGAEGEPGTIRVNSPLEVQGTRLFLTGNGYAPVVEVRDADGEVRFAGPVPFLPEDGGYTSTGVVKAAVPGGDDIGLSGVFLPTAGADPLAAPVSLFPDARVPRLVLTPWVGDIGLGDGTPQSVYDLDTDDMTQMLDDAGEPVLLLLAPGQSVDLPDGAGSVTFVELPRFAAFQVRSDPSGPLALVSASLAMLGLVVSLFLPRRRLWARLTPDHGEDGARRTVVEVGGLSRSRDAGLQGEVDRLLLVAAAAPPTGSPPRSTEPRSTQPLSTDPRSTDPLSTEPRSTDPRSTHPPGPGPAPTSEDR